MHILGVSGSPRRGGNSDLILDRILKGTGAETHLLHLSDIEFSSCVGCERCRKDKICTRFEDDFTPFYQVIKESRGLVLVSPVHNYNITSWMKGFIDRLYCFYDFDDKRPRGWSSRLAGQGRFAALAIVAEQTKEEDLGVTMEALRMPIKALGYQIAGELQVRGKFEAGIVAKDPTILEQAGELGEKLAGAPGSK
ncbi:MAG: flavodoxin family protein [bacterium]|nr:flavodoxin family protein [bacterium]MDT8367458.1 flavodoxin family protein [bacterium]